MEGLSCGGEAATRMAQLAQPMAKPKTPAAAEARLRAALGLMSGTSLDGVDAALIRSDGRGRVEFGPHLTIPYSDAIRRDVRALFGKLAGPPALVEALTHANAEAVEALIARHGVARGEIAVIGYHGQTIWHRPEAGETVQLGDGALLARLTGIDVVNDFRTADGAARRLPLRPGHAVAVPIYQTTSYQFHSTPSMPRTCSRSRNSATSTPGS
jgi:hypothetical protein